jgi:hypothetical protein
MGLFNSSTQRLLHSNSFSVRFVAEKLLKTPKAGCHVCMFPSKPSENDDAKSHEAGFETPVV